MDFEKIKKFLSKKGYRLIKKKGFSHKLKYKNIYTTSFASLIIITFFYILPLSINKVSFKKDLLSHGYLLSGENGIGKRDFANELSKSILCTESDQLFEACGKCNSCKLFAGKSSPDYHFIEEEAGSNTVSYTHLTLPTSDLV